MHFMCAEITPTKQKTTKTVRWTRELSTALKETSVEFRDHTSIHGVKYIFADGIPFYRRIIWSSLFIIALLFCMFMIQHSLREFFTDPIMQKMDAYRKQDGKFNFPAVTVCNANLFLESRGRLFVDILRMPKSRKITRSAVLEALPQLAGLTSPDISDVSVNFETATMLQEVLDYNNMSLKEAYKQLNQPCNELLERCRWEGVPTACSELFERHITFQGYCCSFNYATQRPRLGLYYGVDGGLTFNLNLASHDVMAGSAVSLGARVMVHRNHDFPDMWTKRVRCGMGQECLIDVRPTLVCIEDSVRFLPVHERRCFFPDEIKPNYNALHCRMVCRMKKLQSSCGCSAFYTPRSLVRDYRVCNLRDLHCVSDSKVDLRERWHCPCYHTCTNVQYSQDLRSGVLETTDFFSQEGFYFDANMTDRAVVHIYYGTQLRNRIRTSLCTSVHVLMANVGAYCSLFLGCSLLSGVEIVYFFTIRLLRRLQSKAAKWKPRHKLVSRHVQNRLCSDQLRNKHLSSEVLSR